MKQNTNLSWQIKRNQLDLSLQNLRLVSRSIYNYFKEDREKLIVTIMFILFPIILNSYLLTPDFFIPYYESFHVFIFTISESIGHLILAVAFYFTYRKKDRFMQILPISAIAIICYQLGAKLYTVRTPGSLEIISFVILVVCLVCYLGYIKNNVIPEKNHKMHHGIRQPLSRIKGLAGITMQDKDLQIALMGNEVNKLDELLREYSELFKMEEIE